MTHYEKYLDMLNNNSMTGGRTTEQIQIDMELNFSKSNTFARLPYSWNIQNNILFRDRMFLKLIKLPPDDIKTIIGDKYDTLIKCLMIQLPKAHKNTLTTKSFKFNEIYDKNIKYCTIKDEADSLKKKDNATPIFPKTVDDDNPVIFTRDLIEYFMETHTYINNMSVKSRQMDTTVSLPVTTVHYVRSEKDRLTISEHWNLCKQYFDAWIQNRDLYYNTIWKFINEEKADDINEAYEKLRNTSVLTYLKIRCDDKIKYNQRFNVFLNKNSPTTFYITGPDTNFQARYYKKEGEEKGRFLKDKERAIETINKIKGGTPMTNIADNLVGNPDTQELCYIKKYDYGNLYGPFTKVFEPSISNDDIAKQCTEIKTAYAANKDVFALGYGSSGAGKTSTLIYNKTLGIDGVLLELLKGEMFNGITNIFLTVNELFSITDENKISKKLTMEKNKFNNIKFVRANDGDPFILADNAGLEGTYYENTREILPEAEVEIIKQKARAIAEDPNNYTYDKEYNTADKKYQVGATFVKWQFDHVCYQRIGEETTKLLTDILWIPTKYKWKIVNDGGAAPGNYYFTNVDSENINTPHSPDRTLMLKYSKNLILDKRMRADAGEKKTADGQVMIKYIAKLIFALVDRLRMINPTPNNDVSSRSHILIYIQTRAGGDVAGDIEKTFCVGDLAGVENTFACDTQDTQADFLNIKAIDRRTSKPIIKTNAAGEEMFLDSPANKEPIYREEPWYTRKVKKFQEIPGVDQDPELEIIIDKFLRYDYKKKKFFTELDKENYKTYIAWMDLALVNLGGNYGKLKGNRANRLTSDNNSTKTDLEIAKIYQDKIKSVVGSSLGSKISFNHKFYEKYISNSKTNDAILQIIDSNEDIFTSSGVERLCNERKYEGKFINRALKGMSVDLKTIIDKLTDNGLMKGIQLVHGACFKYHCNKYNAGCFGHLYKTEKTEEEDYIFQDIKENKVKVDNLQIVIFGLLNIDAKYNDPVNIPYFSTNNLKMLRDQFITYLYYSKPNNYTDFIADIKNIYDNPENNYEYKRKTLKYYLDTYKEKLRDDYEKIKDAYNNLVDSKQASNFSSNLQELINKIDQVNSVTVLGTMDYINRLKDNLYTDISCTMVDKDLGDVSLETLKKPFNYYNFGDVTLFPDDDFMNYRNVITNSRLIDVIDAQLFYIENKMEGCANETQLEEPSLLPKTEILDRFRRASLEKGLRNQPDSIVGNSVRIVHGGNNTKIHSSEKQELINEYNRLKKMYKKMKSNLV